MKNIFLLVSIFLFAAKTNAQLDVTFDLSNVEQTIAFLKKKTVSPQDIDQFVASDGVKVIIRKIRSSDSMARITLDKVSKGIKTTGKENDFQYGFIKERLTELEAFSQKIKDNQKVILDSIQALSVYLPAGRRIPLKVVFLAGGYSAGFTLTENNVFYIGTHQYQSDITGIVNTCQHEMFHSLQQLLYNRGAMLEKLQDAKELPALYTYFLAKNIFVEGTAEYVADIDRLDLTTPYMKRQAEHANVNKYRMEDNFYLLERILTDAYINHEKTNVDIYYSVLFDWNWNNPGYQIGKLMTQALIKANGPMVLKKYLAQDPMIFFRDYIKLAKADPKTYPYGFSEEFETIIDSVVNTVEKLNKQK